MHEDHDVSRRARRKDTLSADYLGILLQWHWKYGMSTFTNERQRVQMSLLMLFSAFTGSRPATLLADDSSSSNDSQADDLSNQRSGLSYGLALKYLPITLLFVATVSSRLTRFTISVMCTAITTKESP